MSGPNGFIMTDAGHLTMTDVEYVEHDGNTCPVCRVSGELVGRGSIDMPDGKYMTVEIDCAACGASFHDIYRLAGYRLDPEAEPRGLPMPPLQT